MKNLLYATVAVLALTGAAKADVILDPKLSGTGDNVVFDSVSGNTAIGSLNGQHINLVDYTDLSGSPTFTGAANGNDIKISGTSDLKIQVFDSTNTTVVGTTTQVFSLKGTGDVFLSVVASNGTFNFNLGNISPTAQSGFTLTAINGETMTSLTLLDVGGSISDFEHNRIDVAAAVPLPSAGALASPSGLLAMIFGLAFFGLHRWRKQREQGLPLLWAE